MLYWIDLARSSVIAMVANRISTLPVCERRDAVGDRERRELDLDPELSAKALAMSASKPSWTPRRIDEAPGRVVALDADDDRAGGLGLLQGAGVGPVRGDERQRRRQRRGGKDATAREVRSGC